MTRTYGIGYRSLEDSGVARLIHDASFTADQFSEMANSVLPDVMTNADITLDPAVYGAVALYEHIADALCVQYGFQRFRPAVAWFWDESDTWAPKVESADPDVDLELWTVPWAAVWNEP